MNCYQRCIYSDRVFVKLLAYCQQVVDFWQFTLPTRKLPDLRPLLPQGKIRILLMAYIGWASSIVESIQMWARNGNVFLLSLTHWGRDKMAAVWQTTLSNTYWMKMLQFWLRFHWSLFLKVQLTIIQQWFRQLLGVVRGHVTSGHQHPSCSYLLHIPSIIHRV